MVSKDENHGRVSQWFLENRERLITTDYVFDETLTLLVSRGSPNQARVFGTLIFSGKIAILHHVTESDILAAWRTFSNYTDKRWSFTDCVSKVVMERLGIQKALSFDEHFRQFGTVTVLP